MATPDTPRQFKQDLRDATRAARFENLRDIEIKTGLSRATVSAAFSTNQPLPTEKTVHAIASAIGADATAWTARLRDVPDTPGTPERDETEESHAGGPATAATTTAAPTATDPSIDTTAEVAPGSPPAESRLADDPDGGPSSATGGASAELPTDDQDGPTPLHGRGRRIVVSIGACVIFAAGFTAGYLARSTPTRPHPVAATNAPNTAQTPATPTTSPPPNTTGSLPTTGAQPTRIAETVIPENAAPTFKDPLTVRGLGPKIPANTTVTVSCRLFSDAIASAYPDGYWYRIETTPWNGDYYAAANAFLNGDPAGDPTQYKHPTDLSVPLCR